MALCARGAMNSSGTPPPRHDEGDTSVNISCSMSPHFNDDHANQHDDVHEELMKHRQHHNHHSDEEDEVSSLRFGALTASTLTTLSSERGHSTHAHSPCTDHGLDTAVPSPLHRTYNQIHPQRFENSNDQRTATPSPDPQVESASKPTLSTISPPSQEEENDDQLASTASYDSLITPRKQHYPQDDDVEEGEEQDGYVPNPAMTPATAHALVLHDMLEEGLAEAKDAHERERDRMYEAFAEQMDQAEAEMQSTIAKLVLAQEREMAAVQKARRLELTSACVLQATYETKHQESLRQGYFFKWRVWTLQQQAAVKKAPVEVVGKEESQSQQQESPRGMPSVRAPSSVSINTIPVTESDDAEEENEEELGYNKCKLRKPTAPASSLFGYFRNAVVDATQSLLNAGVVQKRSKPRRWL